MWFVYDPEDPEFEVYLTEEEAKAAFEAIIKRYRTEASLEYAWDEGIGGVCMGRVTHRVELRSVDTDSPLFSYVATPFSPHFSSFLLWFLLIRWPCV